MSAQTAISASKIILPATTYAATSTPIGLSQDLTSVTLVCNGLQDSETAIIQIYDPVSEAYVDYLPVGDPFEGPLQMNSTFNVVTINQVWGAFQIVKSATVAAVGISATQYNPFGRG